jgi:glycosyltransferase involved in cell wall biosynthesis
VVANLEVQAAHFDDTEVTFFAPGDPHSLADALRWVAQHPQEAEAKAERAQRRAAAYSWPHQRDAYQRTLSDLVGGSPAPNQHPGQ